jgi:hypothetical protein
MNQSKPPAKKRVPRRNLVALDGTLDKLDRIQIAVKEVGKNAEPFELRIIHKDAIREHVDCNNPACFNGGFSLGDVLRDMVRGRQEDFIGTNFCTGQEGDPEEEGPHPSCGTRYEVQAVLRFRNS